MFLVALVCLAESIFRLCACPELNVLLGFAATGMMAGQFCPVTYSDFGHRPCTKLPQWHC
jgi:hypothetical protein